MAMVQTGMAGDTARFARAYRPLLAGRIWSRQMDRTRVSKRGALGAFSSLGHARLKSPASDPSEHALKACAQFGRCARAAPQGFAAISASFATVFILRAVPVLAAGMRSLERPMP